MTINEVTENVQSSKPTKHVHRIEQRVIGEADVRRCL